MHLSRLTLRYDSPNFTRAHVVAIMPHEKQTKKTKQLTSPGVHYYCTLLEIRILNLSKNGVFKAPIQTHRKLGIEILIDQFSS